MSETLKGELLGQACHSGIRPMDKRHHPPHVYSDGRTYFFTARVHGGQRFLHSEQKKRLLLSNMAKALRQHHYSLHAWAIMDNHYHMLFTAAKGS